MPTITAHTLGCKVNQYDTQAMTELFENRGYTPVPMGSPADVCLINTCTVTGTGDRKSMQLLRRVLREHPGTHVILCGCLAQREGEKLRDCGALLILGTRERSRVVDLYEQALRENTCLVAVEPLLPGMPYEELQVCRQGERTRGVLKIQEGCRNFCSYCIIPSVRGPVRSRDAESVFLEARRLTEAGYRELVLTGIHLSSYGLDLKPPLTLLSAIEKVQQVPGVDRIRLGSLEPGIATAAFASALTSFPSLCPQFHLALQSGSDRILKAMRRRYDTELYRRSVEELRRAFPGCAITTDVLTGFPGEDEQAFQETRDFLRSIGFARIHVFPYSERARTPAADMPGKVPREIREARARILIRDGKEMALSYQKSLAGTREEVLVEETGKDFSEGYTRTYIRVRIPREPDTAVNDLVPVLLGETDGRILTAHPLPFHERKEDHP